MCEKGFSTDVSHMIVQCMTRQSRNLGMWDSSIGSRVRSLSQRTAKAARDRGSGGGRDKSDCEGRFASRLIFRVENTRRREFIRKSGKKKMPTGRARTDIFHRVRMMPKPIRLQGRERPAWAPCWHLVQISQSMFFIYFIFFSSGGMGGQGGAKYAKDLTK
jgi:hypothetical protein